MIRRALLAAAIAAAWLGAAEARDWHVPAAEGALAQFLDRAAAGDALRLAAGLHRGPVLLDRPVSLVGEPGARIDGGGAGSVITVDAAGVTVSGLEVTGSGSSAQTLDSGIKLTKRAARALVLDNRIVGNLVGVDIHGARDAVVRGNTIIGRRDQRMNERGNAIYVWNAPGAVVEANKVRFGRDGIFVNTSRDNRFIANTFENLRFAIHYMYADGGEVSGNLSRNNHIGYALMNSRDLAVTGNVSDGDRDHGIMLNYVNDARVEGNFVTGGGEKCLFMYNAHKNRIAGNRFEGCPIGVHFTAGSERNAISGNAFLANRTQVKYVGSRWLDWSHDGRGNYWSDSASFDLDGDGIADQPHRPNDLVDHILWTQPAARLLLGSPAIQLLRWTQSRFPALLPGGVIDRAPLMAPPEIAASRLVARP
jgi:nitrous oxidase accessory protein